MNRIPRRLAALCALLFLLLGVSLRADVSPGGAAPTLTPTQQTKPAAGAPGVRWGFYVTYNPNSWTSLQANAKHLNYVSPWFFYVDKAGKVTGNDQPQVSALLRKVGAKSLPMVQNVGHYDEFTTVLSDTAKQIAIVDQLDALVTANRYDGITIDFEWVNAADRPLLTAFMGRLYEKLHPKGKLVAMAVAAKTKETNTGWSGGYDYKALSAVTDYILVMAYDYHWAQGEPGPVAPISRLKATADYTLSQIPAKKVIWGVGAYGYDWGKDDEGKSTGKAESRTHAEALALALAPGAESGYDKEAQAPWVRYTRDGQPREMWYEDRRSFEAKLELIEKRGMAGFGVWRLGQEDPQIWGPVIAGSRPPAACAPIKSFTSVSDKVYFSQTKHSLRGRFLSYWRERGGLPIFGYPLTEEFDQVNPADGKKYKVQYFERNRFEYHPENKKPNDVQLGLLGVQVAGNRTFPPAADPLADPSAIYFPQVKHTLGGPFLSQWQRKGGLAQFGYPISEPVMERNIADGKTYVVQYLQRARFEFHPEHEGTEAEVLLGLLGRDVSPCE